MSSVRVVTLLFLALNSMAQPLPRPTGLYFEPLLQGQSAMLQDDGDKIIPQIANHGTPQDGGFFMIFQAVNVSAATATFQVEFFDNNGEAMNLPPAASSDDLIGTPAHGQKPYSWCTGITRPGHSGESGHASGGCR